MLRGARQRKRRQFPRLRPLWAPDLPALPDPPALQDLLARRLHHLPDLPDLPALQV